MERNKSHESQYASSLIEASIDPLVTISMDGKIMDLNQAKVNVTGLKRDSLLGTDFSRYFTEPEKAQNAYLEVFSKGSFSNIPLTFRHKKGKLTDVLFNGSVFKDTEGKVIGAILVARDISEQKWAVELRAANKELAFQNNEKEKRAKELSVANIELAFQNKEKEKRARELIVANKELVFQNKEKEKRAAELIIANKELQYQNREKKKRADELAIADIELDFQNREKDKRESDNRELMASGNSAKLASEYTLSLIEASRDPLVTISPEGKITDMNEALTKITGINREKLKGTDFFDYFTEPKMARKVYKEVFAKGSVADSPLTLRHKSGKLTDVLFNGSVYKDDLGNVLGVVIVARDVTLQNIASQYARSLIEASYDPLFTISPAGKITDMNDASVNITGVSREKMIGTDFFNYFTEPQKARKVYKEVFAKGFVVDSPLTIRDHKLTDVLFNGSVYKDAQGNVIGAVVVARDITDQKRIATELTEAIVFAELATGLAEDAKIKAEKSTQIAENAGGFAVVAAEVRALALRSSQAAAQIKSLISESIDTVRSGTELVGHAGQRIEEIVASVRQVGDVFAHLSADTHEHAGSIGAVTEAVKDLDQVTRQNVSVAQSTRRIAQSLHEEGLRLEEVLGSFRVGQADGAARSAARPAARTEPAPAAQAAPDAVPQQTVTFF